MKPSWLKVNLTDAETYKQMHSLVDGNTHTICEEAKCPNICECWKNKTATFLILGKNCTRNCKYCNVSHDKVDEIDRDEALKIAEIVKKLGLKYVVITSVTRDDLEDGGASVFVDVINEIRNFDDKIKIELLIPDNIEIKKIMRAKPDVLGHNIEVVETLFKKIRPIANYRRSLELLKKIKQINPGQKTKSGLMIGFGESKQDIINTMKDLRQVDVDIFTLGQYLQPRRELVEVKKYYTPKEFEELKNIGLELGFSHVESGPLVRSSYHAKDAFD